MKKLVISNVPNSTATPKRLSCVCVNEVELPTVVISVLEAITEEDIRAEGRRLTIPLGEGNTLTTFEIIKVEKIGPGRTIYHTLGNQYCHLDLSLESHYTH